MLKKLMDKKLVLKNGVVIYLWPFVGVGIFILLALGHQFITGG